MSPANCLGWLLVGLACLVSGSEQPTADAEPGTVFIARLEGDAITPGTERYLIRAMDEAEDAGAECIVMVLDTPGGLVTSTRRLVKRILASNVCVVVYVAPPGARAASAGLFITLAAHVAAMAPSTNIGAAHPVSIGGDIPPGLHGNALRELLRGLEQEDQPASSSPHDDSAQTDKANTADRQPAGSEVGQLAAGSGEPPTGKQAEAAKPETAESAPEEAQKKQDRNEQEKRGDAESAERSVMEDKIVNDMEAWVRALARQRNRNAEWAAKAVRESVSITAAEALEQNVVDLVAADLGQLLTAIDGRQVQLASGPKQLRTQNVTLKEVPLWWGEKVLALLSEPNVAFLLMIFGFYGIYFELYTPGWGIPGTVGLICLLLGLFGLSVLPVNYLGLGLIFVAVGLFMAEAFVHSFGVLTLAGIACMILGGLMLVDSPAGFSRVSLGVVVPVALATAAIIVLLVAGIVRVHSRRATTGEEAMKDACARARSAFQLQDGVYRGKVFVHGEWWNAASQVPLSAGQSCRIVSVEGMTLHVEPV